MGFITKITGFGGWVKIKGFGSLIHSTEKVNRDISAQTLSASYSTFTQSLRSMLSLVPHYDTLDQPRLVSRVPRVCLNHGN